MKIDLDKFVADFMSNCNVCSGTLHNVIENALKAQGLEYKDGEIVEISPKKDICSDCVNVKGCVTCVDGDMKETLKQDSEDEKIRKNIIGHFKYEVEELTQKGEEFEAEIEELSKYITWLEKQKRLFEPYDWNKYKDKPVEVWNAYIHGKAVGLELGRNSVKNNPKEYGLVEQKPEWSDEDEICPRTTTHIACMQRKRDCRQLSSVSIFS